MCVYTCTCTTIAGCIGRDCVWLFPLPQAADRYNIHSQLEHCECVCVSVPYCLGDVSATPLANMLLLCMNVLRVKAYMYYDPEHVVTVGMN